jgi:beta-lactamase regulating signal transducer with metallopeptidase domain/uncharacterized coiled-coil protein SlyX
MEFYLLKSSALLLILIAFHKIVLENISSHQFKRTFLLVALLITVSFPLITVQEDIVWNDPILATEPSSPIVDSSTGAHLNEDAPINITYIILSVYWIVVILFSLNFMKNFGLILLKIIKNKRIKRSRIVTVLVNERITPHTFFKYIFFNKSAYENNTIPASVVLHEQTHAQQYHSIDVLLIELFQIFFWFNPATYSFKKSIKLNHEFLADQEVIKKGFQIDEYQKTLLAFSSSAYQNQLANAINYSLIKKRFRTMKTKTSRKSTWMRSLLLLPLLALLLYSFGERKTTYQTKESEVSMSEKILIVTIQDKDHFRIHKQLINRNELAKKIKEYPNSKIIFKSSETVQQDWLNHMVKTLKDAGIEQTIHLETHAYKMDKDDYQEHVSISEATVMLKANDIIKTSTNDTETYPTFDGKTCHRCLIEIPFKSQKDFKLGTNTSEKITDFKINFLGKPSLAIKGNSLNSAGKKYFNDAKMGETIVIYGITTKAGKLNSDIQILMTDPKHDQERASKEMIKEYDRLAKIFNSKLSPAEKQKIKTRMEYIYKLMTPEQKKDAHLPPPPPPVPFSKDANGKASSEEVKEYNALAKKYTANPKGIIKSSEVQRMGYLYKKMSEKQRSNATAFPNIAPPPPIPPTPPKPNKKSDKASAKELKEYNTLAKKYTNKPEGVIKSSEIKRIGYLYKKMSEKQRSNATAFPNIAPPPPIPPNPNR